MEREGTLPTHELASLRDHFGVLVRRKWIVLQAVLLVPSIAVLLAVRQDSVYQATAEVLLNSQNLALTLTGTADPTSNRTPERVAETQAQLARVPEVARRVLTAAELWDRTPEQFLLSSSVGARPNADLLLFAVQDVDPALASQLATLYAHEYTRYRRELDTEAIKRARVDVEREIARLERQDLRRSALYASLMDKQQQLKTIEALQTSNASVVREAGFADKVTPKPKQNAILGLVLGVVLGIGLAFLREALDTRARSTEEIERGLGLPLLARIPQPSRDLRRANRLVMMARPDSNGAEPYRILRTNFDFFNLELGARTVMITSAVGREGKSTTISNLALALARAGQRVVLVDLDLRRPILGRLFNLAQPGAQDITLTRGLLEQADFEQPDEVFDPKGGSLEVLTSNRWSANAGEYVGSEELGHALESLRDRANIVLVDAPPLLLLGDALQIAARVDAIIVVTRLGVLRRQMLTDLRRALEACPAEKLGFIVTGADRESNYHYAYGYGAYQNLDSQRLRRQ